MDIPSWRRTLALALTSVSLTAVSVALLHPLAAYAANPPTAKYEPAAQAGILTVTKLADTDDGTCDADCSLREAIAAADAGDTIVFTNTLAGQTIPLASQLDISKTLTIDGSSLGTPINISGQNAVRVFNIASSGGVTLSHLNIVSGTIGLTDYNGGGGIYNAAGSQLTVQYTAPYLATQPAAAAASATPQAAR
jgi:CSLREA domain-containing protein